MVYYNKFNRQKFNISPYCPKVIKFLLYEPNIWICKLWSRCCKIPPDAAANQYAEKARIPPAHEQKKINGYMGMENIISMENTGVENTAVKNTDMKNAGS